MKEHNTPQTNRSLNKTKEKLTFQRESSLDLIKIIAVFLVISVHFFMYNGFYKEPVTGGKMYIAMLMRTFFSVCVPLFIICTGYLMSLKKISNKYYLGLKKVLLTYLVSSIICLICQAIHMKTMPNWKVSIYKIFDFTAAKYAWYVEMYIGLFLLIPFLNLAYHHLENRKQKLILIWTLVVITILPTFLRVFIFDPAWWDISSSSEDYKIIVFSWWTIIYPVTYYCVGCYLREYGLKFKTKTLILFLLASVVIFASFNYYRYYNGTFKNEPFNDWYGFEPFIMSVPLFELLNRIKANNLPVKFRKILAYIANMTLMIYLLSYVFDKIFYKYLTDNIPHMPDRLKYYFVLVIPIFLCSLCLSAIVTTVQDFTIQFVKKIYNNIRPKSKEQ